jgi:phosphohistidine phosphatase
MDKQTLVVMRHAKTNPTSPTGDDFCRALTTRGSADALAIGHWLHATCPHLAHILSSTALRTRETVAALCTPWGEAPPATEWDPALYLAELDTLLKAVERLSGRTALLVGHNPGLEELLRFLVPDVGQAVGLPKLMPTAAVYVLQLPRRRGAPQQGSAVILSHMRPKLLTAT